MRSEMSFAIVRTSVSLLLCALSLGGCSSECPSGYDNVNHLCKRKAIDAGPATGQTNDPETAQASLAGAASQGGAGSSSASMLKANPAGGSPSWSPMASAGASAGSSGPGSNDHGDSNAPSHSGESGADATTGAAATAGAAAPSGPCASQPGGTVCEGAQLHHCDAKGGVSTSETCMSEALCEIGAPHGACAVCAPQTFQCEGTQLQECNDSGQYALKATCDTAALCMETAGACTPMLCSPNSKQCGGDGTLRICNADGSAFEQEAPCGVGLCDGTNGRCNVCRPGAKRCSGASVLTCSSDGQNETMMACTPRDTCWSAACTGSGNCQQTPAPANTKCATGVCDGLGSCVGCLTNANCSANQVCDPGSRSCMEKPCGNGQYDPGESCEIAAPNQYTGGTCNPSNCLLTERAYSSCTLTGGPTSPCSPTPISGWFCGSASVCTRGCSESDQCKTDTGRGVCVSGFCAIQ
jgi:hypothetical protein